LDQSQLVEALIVEIKLDCDSVNQLLPVTNTPQLDGKGNAVTEVQQVGPFAVLHPVMMLTPIVVVIRKLEQKKQD